MKKSQRLRFHDLARRQNDLNDAERAELEQLHLLAIKHPDQAADIDDLPKKAAPAAPRPGPSAKEFDDLATKVGALGSEVSSLRNQVANLSKQRNAPSPTPAAPAEPAAKG